MAGAGAANVVDTGAADEVAAVTHPSVGYDEHPSTGELGSPAEVDILTSTGDAGVKAADRGKEARAYQHTCRRYGENVANSVVLLLVSLVGFDHVGRSSELIDDETDVLQDLRVLPLDELGACDAGVGPQRFGDEHAYGVGGQGDVVVTNEQEGRLDVGLEDGVGRCGKPDRVGCVDQGRVGRNGSHSLVEAALGRSVDDDNVQAGVILGDDAVERLLEPGPGIMSHHHGSDRWCCGALLTRYVGAHVGDWDVGHGLRRLPLDSPVDVALPPRPETTPRQAPKMVAHP